MFMIKWKLRHQVLEATAPFIKIKQQQKTITLENFRNFTDRLGSWNICCSWHWLGKTTQMSFAKKSQWDNEVCMHAHKNFIYNISQKWKVNWIVRGFGGMPPPRKFLKSRCKSVQSGAFWSSDFTTKMNRKRQDRIRVITHTFMFLEQTDRWFHRRSFFLPIATSNAHCHIQPFFTHRLMFHRNFFRADDRY